MISLKKIKTKKNHPAESSVSFSSKLNIKDVADLSQGPKGPNPSTSAPNKKTPSAVGPKVDSVEKKTP